MSIRGRLRNMTNHGVELRDIVWCLNPHMYRETLPAPGHRAPEPAGSGCGISKRGAGGDAGPGAGPPVHRAHPEVRHLPAVWRGEVFIDAFSRPMFAGVIGSVGGADLLTFRHDSATCVDRYLFLLHRHLSCWTVHCHPVCVSGYCSDYSSYQCLGRPACNGRALQAYPVWQLLHDHRLSPWKRNFLRAGGQGTKQSVERRQQQPCRVCPRPAADAAGQRHRRHRRRRWRRLVPQRHDARAAGAHGDVDRAGAVRPGLAAGTVRQHVFPMIMSRSS